jgi:hypothetical protein
LRLEAERSLQAAEQGCQIELHRRQRDLTGLQQGQVYDAIQYREQNLAAVLDYLYRRLLKLSTFKERFARCGIP